MPFNSSAEPPEGISATAKFYLAAKVSACQHAQLSEQHSPCLWEWATRCHILLSCIDLCHKRCHVMLQSSHSSADFTTPQDC